MTASSSGENLDRASDIFFAHAPPLPCGDCSGRNLHEFFDATQTKMNTTDEPMSGDFFASKPARRMERHGQHG